MTVKRALLAAAAASFLLCVAMSLARSGPVLMADEAGYLGNARLLGGGLEFEMGTSPFYRAGYSLLLAPVVGLGGDPETTYGLVLVINAALAASLVPLLYLLLTRCFEVSPKWALGGAIAGAVYPTVLSLSQVAMSENALFPLTILWLLAVGGLLRSRGRGDVVGGLAAGASAAALWVVHGRMIVALALTVLMLVGLVVRGRISRRAGIAGFGVIAVGLVAGSLLNDLVVDRNYDGREVNEVSDTLGSVDDLDAALAVLRNLIGESWYLLVASFGLVGLLLAAQGRVAATKLLRGEDDVPALSLALLLGLAAGLLVVTAVWFVDATRPDQIAYGRYVEPTLPPLVALGVVTAAARPSGRATRLVIAGIAVFTITVAALASGLDFPGQDANRWNLAGLPFIARDLGPEVIIGAGAVAATGAFAILATARRAPWAAWLAAVALFVPVAVYNEIRLVLQSDNDAYPAGWTSPQSIVEARGDEVAYDVSRLDRFAVKAYQWFLPDTPFELYDGGDTSPPAPLFFSASKAARKRSSPGAQIVWRDHARDQVLWRSGR